MPLDLDVLDIFSASDVWIWFQFTGSCLVWVVTFGQVWLMDEHEHWAGFIGLMLHAAVIAGVIYCANSHEAQSAPPPPAKMESVHGS